MAGPRARSSTSTERKRSRPPGYAYSYRATPTRRSARRLPRWRLLHGPRFRPFAGRRLGMPQNFLTCDRDQPMLLPPDLRDWPSDDHLAWFVIDAVRELDLEPFYAAYRADGHGAAAHDPQMVVTLFAYAYAYAVGELSSRGIERRCRESSASGPSASSWWRATAPSASRPAGGDWPRIGEPSGGRTSATRPTAPAGGSRRTPIRPPRRSPTPLPN